MQAEDVHRQQGQRAAEQYLKGCGFRILDHDWKCPDGEINIVAVERNMLVVCDLRRCSGTRYGTPLETMSQAKCRRLRRLAVCWLNAHGVRFEQIRIDVVGLLYEGSGGFTIEHIRGVG
jgi:putative endonuclease